MFLAKSFMIKGNFYERTDNRSANIIIINK